MDEDDLLLQGLKNKEPLRQPHAEVKPTSSVTNSILSDFHEMNKILP